MPNPRNPLFAAAALMMLATIDPGTTPVPRAKPRRVKTQPSPSRRNTALDYEIAEHNAEVDRRNAQKRERRSRRKTTCP